MQIFEEGRDISDCYEGYECFVEKDGVDEWLNIVLFCFEVKKNSFYQNSQFEVYDYVDVICDDIMV